MFLTEFTSPYNSGSKREKELKLKWFFIRNFPFSETIWLHFRCSPLSPARPSDKSITNTKTTENEGGKFGGGGELVPLSLCPPQRTNKICPWSIAGPPQREAGQCPPWATARLNKAEYIWVKRKPTWCHLFYYLFNTHSMLNMFRPLIRPSSGVCD